MTKNYFLSLSCISCLLFVLTTSIFYSDIFFLSMFLFAATGSYIYTVICSICFFLIISVVNQVKLHSEHCVQSPHFRLLILDCLPRLTIFLSFILSNVCGLSVLVAFLKKNSRKDFGVVWTLCKCLLPASTSLSRFCIQRHHLLLSSNPNSRHDFN